MAAQGGAAAGRLLYLAAAFVVAAQAQVAAIAGRHTGAVALMRALRELVLGETWSLPLGVAVTVAAALALHALAGESAWWRG